MTNLEDKNVLYKEGDTSIYTVLNDNDCCIYSGENIKTIQKENNNIKKMTFPEALEKINIELKNKYSDKWKRITKEKYWEMLEVLPPKKYGSVGNATMFAMSEFMESCYTEHFIEYKNKYYCAIRDFTIKPDVLLFELKKQLGEV